MDFFDSTWPFLLLAIAFIHGLFWMANEGTFSSTIHRLARFKLLRDVSKLNDSPIVYHSPLTLYFFVWQQALAVAAGMLFACLAVLIPSWLVVAYANVSMAMPLGISLFIVACAVWKWLSRLP